MSILKECMYSDCKGVMGDGNSNVGIDRFVPVKEFSTFNCNFAALLMANICPAGTLFVVIFNADKD